MVVCPGYDRVRFGPPARKTQIWQTLSTQTTTCIWDISLAHRGIVRGIGLHHKCQTERDEQIKDERGEGNAGHGTLSVKTEKGLVRISELDEEKEFQCWRIWTENPVRVRTLYDENFFKLLCGYYSIEKVKVGILIKPFRCDFASSKIEKSSSSSNHTEMSQYWLMWERTRRTFHDIPFLTFCKYAVVSGERSVLFW